MLEHDYGELGRRAEIVWGRWNAWNMETGQLFEYCAWHKVFFGNIPPFQMSDY